MNSAICDIFINVISGLIVTAITGYVVFAIFKKPDFDLLIESYTKEQKDILSISIVNKKHFLSFEKDTVYINFYIPKKLIENSEVYKDAPSGLLLGGKHSIPITSKDEAILKGNEYQRLGLEINYFIHANTTIRTLYFSGKAGHLNQYNGLIICAQFKTPSGIFPKKGPVDLNNPKSAICKTINI
jgi:hypothetical protein